MKNKIGNQLTLFPDPIYQNTSFKKDAEAFKEVTGVKLFVDGFISVINKRKYLDVCLLDKRLREVADDCDQPLSFNELVLARYGEDIAYLTRKWTK